MSVIAGDIKALCAIVNSINPCVIIIISSTQAVGGLVGGFTSFLLRCSFYCVREGIFTITSAYDCADDCLPLSFTVSLSVTRTIPRGE